MIARLWRGWTAPENADAYEQLLHTEILPGLTGIDGYRGAYVLRREDDGRVAFITITFFESLAAVRAFAGESYEGAVLSPGAHALLARFDDAAEHFDVRLSPAV